MVRRLLQYWAWGRRVEEARAVAKEEGGNGPGLKGLKAAAAVTEE